MIVNRAVILAGGKGTRLAPLTTVIPKPLVPLGDTSILEVVLRQLRYFGITHTTLAVGHLSHLIKAVLGDGARFDLELTYTVEDTPLGTAGPLTLVPNLTDTFLVMNGDLLTDIDLQAMTRFHQEAHAVATVGLYSKKVRIDLGVLDVSESGDVLRYTEKPELAYEVSMGIYLFEPAVVRYIPSGQRFDLPSVITALVEDRQRVIGYRHQGYWLDLGTPADYDAAVATFTAEPERFVR
jgi:NDP-sugar pyrophosphorylase family protein